MQINLLQLFSQALGTPSGTGSIATGGFAEFLEAASPPNWPPGATGAIPPFAPLSENGKDLSIKQNAGESELDPNSTSKPEGDTMLAFAPSLAGPIVVQSTPQTLVQTSQTIRTTSRLLGNFTMPLSGQDFTANFLGLGNSSLPFNIPRLDQLGIGVPQVGKFPEFNPIRPNSLPSVPAFNPTSSPWQFSPIPTFGPQMPIKVLPEGLVQVSGLIKAPSAETQLDTTMVDALGVVELTATAMPVKGVPATLEEAVEPLAIQESLGKDLETLARFINARTTDLPETGSRFPVTEVSVANVVVRDLPKEAMPEKAKKLDPNDLFVNNSEVRPRRERASAALGADPIVATFDPKFGSQPQLETNPQPEESFEANVKEVELSTGETVTSKSEPVQVISQTSATSREVARLDKLSPLTPEDQKLVLEQAIDKLDRHTIHRPLSQMVIRLMPKELGEITLTIKSIGVKSEAKVEATDPRVAHALQAEQPRLTQAIEAKGLNLTSLSFQFNERGQQEASQNNVSQTSVPAPDREGASTPPTSVLADAGSDSLNLVI